MIRNFFVNVILSPIGIVAITAALLLGPLWYLGPLVEIVGVRPFDTVLDRVAATLSILAAATIFVLIILLSRRSRETQISEEIAKQAAEDTAEDEAVRSELAEIGARLKTALHTLRKSRTGGWFGKRHLYQLPWYIMIGPPGAGKTTAIVNSGLKFPLADSLGKEAVGGVGGTRNCDWWFTNDAVLLDTAGRYTTQDSNASADSRAWVGFLEMLKKYRSRQPINGAMVAISVSDLSEMDEVTAATHAQAIRVRLQELRDRLGVSFPVYVILTKADLVAGFQEFFDGLGSKEREQVWGITLPLATGKVAAAPVAESFRTEFDGLVARLSDHSLERIQAETDFQRRTLIAGFATQMASLRDAAETFLGEIFQESRYSDPLLLRGVYFTSGTQEGMPIDRLMAGMSRNFGIGRQAIGSGQGQGRSFFLTRLMTDVIFGEAGLVSRDDAVERRTRWVTRGSIATGLAAFALVCGVLLNSFVGNRSLIAQTSAQISTFQVLAADIPQSPISDSDLAPVAPALNILRDMPGNPAATDPEPPRALTYGLYQGDVIGTETAQSYRAALNSLMLPRLLVRLEDMMQSNLNDSAGLFEALKTYMMLGLQVPMDADHVSAWLADDWENLFPGQPSLQADLQGHLAELLGQPMQEIALNGPLVAQVQAILSETPISERVYVSIVTSPEAQALAPFRITEVGGPAASRVLVRPSGRPLTSGIEGVYTRTGFYDFFLPQILIAAERIQRDSLILGPGGQIENSPQALALISRDVLALYETDFVARYDELLADIDVLPMTNLGQATDVINILSGPISPLRNLLEGVTEQTRLTVLPSVAAVTGVAAAEAQEFAIGEVVRSISVDAEDFFNAVRGTLEQIPDAEPVAPGQFVEDRFQEIHRLTDRTEGPSELDRIIQLMTDVYNELNRLSLGQNLGTALLGDSQNAPARLQAEIGRMPAPMERWATQVVQSSAGAAIGGARSEINTKWQSEVLPFCTRAINDRYPFNRQAQADVALQDFGRLFGPGGLMETFFDENLARFVDTSQNPWQVRRVNGIDVGVSNAVVQQFQRADEIKNSFFVAPGLPNITLEITPSALDPNVERVTLETGGQTVSYAHGPPQASALRWPGELGARTRVAFTPTRSDVRNDVTHDGPWALFRLLDAAEVRRTNVSDRNRIVFNVGGRIAIFQLRAGSVLNPFTLDALSTFSCPTSL
ncbi:type VI secretion system membrane subunit TssM [uncultured Tateyamaria sp.]|uniref:type VI secretion system membrane subunit TssM n=1 Tax=uncultured Tateyamaria sp. TaxID=455651 RepID=UPI00262A994D|nr:type VI secretion system membrane subunit TssM [uncultured Tateyamaria sp.]